MRVLAAFVERQRGKNMGLGKWGCKHTVEMLQAVLLLGRPLSRGGLVRRWCMLVGWAVVGLAKVAVGVARVLVAVVTVLVAVLVGLAVGFVGVKVQLDGLGGEGVKRHGLLPLQPCKRRWPVSTDS